MRKTPFALAALLAVAGICVMLWPVFTGHRLQADTDAAVQEFLLTAMYRSSSIPNCWQPCRSTTVSFTQKSNPALLISKPVKRLPLTLWHTASRTKSWAC